MGIGDGHDLSSPRFSGDPILEACCDEEHRMLAGESGRLAVLKVQQALIDLGFPLTLGADGIFGEDTGNAVVRFKTSRQIFPNDPVVGPKTMAALDAEIIAFDAEHIPQPPPTPLAPLHTVTFWINAFIPDPSLTPFVLPAPGASTGLSMIVIPANQPPNPLPKNRAFLGDNRGFSSDVSASARIHSLAEINNLDTETPQLQTVDNRCGRSHEIDIDSDEIIAEDTAPTDRIRFLHLRGNTSIDPEGGVVIDSESPRFVQLDYEAAANLPLLFPSPDIDLVGVLGIDRDNRAFRFRGSVDGFPAFEAYVRFNLGPPVTLFRMLPVAPVELIGDVKRPVDVTVPIVT
jgi:hypothetical protein